MRQSTWKPLYSGHHLDLENSPYGVMVWRRRPQIVPRGFLGERV